MPRGKEQKYPSKDVNKWKLEFQFAVWGERKANSSGACCGSTAQHTYWDRSSVLQDRSSDPRAELGDAGFPSWEGESGGAALPNGSVGWSWEGSTLRSSVSVSLCGNAYLTWQALLNLT